LYNQYSPCARANGVVGNMTIQYNIKLEPRASGYATLRSGTFKDLDSEEEIDNVLTLNAKWLIRECSDARW